MRKILLLMMFTFGALGARAVVRHWVGTGVGDSSLAANADNWSPAGVPTAEDDVVLDADSCSRPLVWNLSNGVKSWTQTADYAGLVMFKSGRSGIANKVSVTAYGESEEGSGDLWFKVSGDVTLENGVWTHPVQPAFNNSDLACTNGLGIWRLLVRVGGKMEIGSLARVDVSSNGFLTATGPGRSSSSDYGASHGGRGTAYHYSVCSSRCPRDCYGSVKYPRTLGSGGNYSSGGGAVELVVDGALTLNGAIRANGNDYKYGTSTVQPYHAPSGGSVFVTAGSLSGSGFISADGATCTSGGCGGGGRVAVKLTGTGATFADFPKTHVTASGKWSNGVTSFCGPVYFETKADDGEGELLVRGTDASTTAIDFSINYVLSTQLRDLTDDYSFSRIVLTNAAVLGFEPGVLVKTKQLVSLNANANKNQLAFKGGQLQLDASETISNVYFRIYNSTFPLAFEDGASQTTVFGTGTVVEQRVPVAYPGSLTVKRGASIVHPTNGSSFSYRLDSTVAGDLTVEEGGSLDASARGYAFNVGHGSGHLGLGDANGVGGSHGGLARGVGCATCYGSVSEPDEPGAGNRTSFEYRAYGGGVIRLNVTGLTTVDGRIAANGASPGWVGGAGGSVLLRTGRLAGTGTISADGGNTDYGGEWYPGGGGRVAVYLNASNAEFGSAPLISAYGGKYGSSYSSAAGTVYLSKGSEGTVGGRLIVDNGNRKPGVARTVFGAEVTCDTVGSVIVTNAAKLYLESGRTLCVSNDWMNSATFESEIGGIVNFVGTGTSRICGTNSFADLVCTVPGKTLLFGTAGSRLNVLSGGTLTLQGDATSPLVLDRLGESGLWPLALASGSSMALTFLDVSNSDARHGAVEAFATESTGRDNEGWSIFGHIEPGETIVWKGTTDGNWTVKENWDPSRLPIETDRIVIDPAPHAPCLSGDTVAGRVTVAEGAALYLSGCGLSVTDGFTCAGALVFTGAERLALSGDLDFSGATLTGTPAQVSYVCDGARTVNFAGLSLGNLVFTGAGAATLPQGFATDDFTLSAAEALRLSVSPGAVIATTDLHVDGGEGMSLRLWGETGAWNLSVSRFATVVGLSVSNCVATGARDITADEPSEDRGGNVRWHFPSGGVSVWTGGTSGSYEDASGWSTKAVPGAGAHVQIPADVTVTATGRVAVRQLTISGSLVCSAGFEASDSVVIQSGGKLTSNRPSSVAVLLLLESGATLTHAGNTSAEVNRLDLAVGGDAIVEAGACIDVTAKGYSSNWYGPGAGVNTICAASHGGRGALWVESSASQIRHCYGSVFTPTNMGSCTYYNSISSAGGGVVRLNVGGTLRLDGDVVADGEHKHVTYYSGAGGSVFLRAASIAGAGKISANGGYFVTACGGAGGRVAICQTSATDFSSYTGLVEAHAGYRIDSGGTLYTPEGAAGTIYRESAGEPPGTGTITIDAGGAAISARSQYTELPVIGVGGEDRRSYGYATVRLANKAVLGLTDDLTIGELELPSGTEVRLYGHVLRIRSKRHWHKRGWSGTVTLGGGRIVWGISGLQLIVR